MLGNYNTTEARANFLCVPGREIEYEYNSANNVIKEIYKEGEVVIFAVNYEYSTNGNITRSYCTNE